MFKSKMRNIGISALVGAGLLAGGSAEAYNLRLGSVDIQIDTISSIGMTYRVADRETDLLAEGNGGRPTMTPLSESGYALALAPAARPFREAAATLKPPAAAGTPGNPASPPSLSRPRDLVRLSL